jgi:hypothetical protein
MQRTSKEAGVELEFDPTKQDMIKLYVYAMEQGSNSDIKKAIEKKAKNAAASFPLKYGNIGIVLDNSRSMYGSDTQKNRPLAISLAMKDILTASAKKTNLVVTGGELDQFGLTKASGSTSLAEALLEVIENNPDAVYILSDGYENTPAGRVNEVICSLREMGIDTPIFQMSPVMATESAGLRKLSEKIEQLPVSRPEGVGLALIRAAINQDQLEQGITGLLDIVKSKLLLE